MVRYLWYATDKIGNESSIELAIVADSILGVKQQVYRVLDITHCMLFPGAYPTSDDALDTMSTWGGLLFPIDDMFIEDYVNRRKPRDED